MSIKRKLFELLIGHTIEQEYYAAARDRYEEVVEAFGTYAFPPDDMIAHFHVGSSYKAPNILKVKTRMLITRHFIKENIKGDVRSMQILDVGGSSTILFNMLGIGEKNGFVVNIIKEFVDEVARAGYGAVLVKDEKLPFCNKSFDYCFSFECLEHMYSPFLHLCELKRVSKKGFFVSIPYRETTTIVNKKGNLSRRGQHIFEFSPHDLEKITTHCDVKMKNHTLFSLESGGNNFLRKLYRLRFGWGKPSVFLAYYE